MSEIAVKIEDLTVAYEEKPVLWDIDLDIEKGSLMAIVGPNGAGKTTLIKSVLGLVKPVAGKVTFFGKSYRSQRKLVAYVPQRSSVDWDFPTTVFDVTLMGSYGRLGWLKRPGKKEKILAEECLDLVGMKKFKDRQINNLSGGQQQRVFLARALMQQPEIYLMDEPFQGVDATTEKAIIKILKELRDSNKTVVCVHHDIPTVRDYFDSVTILNIRKIASGDVDKVLNYENLREAYGGTKTYKGDEKGNILF